MMMRGVRGGTKSLKPQHGVEEADPEVITACAVSGAAVGSNPGSLSSSSWPSSFLSTLGGCCSRWVRLTQPDRLDLFWYMLTSFTFAAVGGVMLAGGLECEPVQYTGSWNAGTNPCGGQPLVFGSAVAAFAIVNGVVVLVLAFPFFGWFLYTTGAISTGFVSGLFSVLGVTFYARTRCCAWRARVPRAATSGDDVQRRELLPPSGTATTKQGDEGDGAVIPRRVLAADGGSVEVLGLLPVLMEAFQGGTEPIGSSAHWAPHHIICFDGSELVPKTETCILLHAVRLASELLGLEATFDPSVTPLDIAMFFGNEALRHIPAADRALWAKLCSSFLEREEREKLIQSAVNRSPDWWQEDMKREATCWVRILPIIFKQCEGAEANNAANKTVKVWYTRPAHPQKWIKSPRGEQSPSVSTRGEQSRPSVEYTVEASKDLYWPTWRWGPDPRLDVDIAAATDMAVAAARVRSELKEKDAAQEREVANQMHAAVEAPQQTAASQGAAALGDALRHATQAAEAARAELQALAEKASAAQKAFEEAQDPQAQQHALQVQTSLARASAAQSGLEEAVKPLEEAVKSLEKAAKSLDVAVVIAAQTVLAEVSLEFTHAVLLLWDFAARERIQSTQATLELCDSVLERFAGAQGAPAQVATGRALLEVSLAREALKGLPDNPNASEHRDAAKRAALRATRAAQAMCRLASHATGEAPATKVVPKSLTDALHRLDKLDKYRGRTPLDTTILRTMATTMLFGVLCGFLGLLEDFVFSTFLMMCSFSVKIDPYNMAALGFALAVISLVLLMMADVRIGTEKRTLSDQIVGAVLISAFPIIQCALSVQMAFLPDDSYQWNAFYAPLWTIVGAGVGLIVGTFGVSFLVGTFPNQSTAFMQPTSDAQVFDAYREAGQRVALECMARIAREGVREGGAGPATGPALPAPGPATGPALPAPGSAPGAAPGPAPDPATGPATGLAPATALAGSVPRPGAGPGGELASG